jgi:hypothetical protein
MFKEGAVVISVAQRVQIDLKYSALAKTQRGKGIRAYLESHPKISAAAGKRWLQHLIYQPASSVIRDLTCWYMWVEDEQGKSAASDALDRYLESEFVKTTFCIWVFGIKPKKV